MSNLYMRNPITQDTGDTMAREPILSDLIGIDLILEEVQNREVLSDRLPERTRMFGDCRPGMSEDIQFFSVAVAQDMSAEELVTPFVPEWLD